jgi:hypothetical protein
VYDSVVLAMKTGPEIFYQDNEFKIKTLEKMSVFGIFVPL